MSTFSGLNTAFRGLNAARMGLDVVGQNMTNLTTAGYTRQRLTTEAVGSLAQIGPLFGGAPRVGQGVVVSAIARLGDESLDARVRFSAGASGNLDVRANALTAVQAALHEPGETGLSAQLTQFWSAWGDVSNRAGEQAPAGVLLQKAAAITNQIAAGYTAVDQQWSELRGNLDGMANDLNDAGSQVAALNGQIRTTLAQGGSVNELLDQRSLLTSSIASLTGATVRNLPDGTVDVLIGGSTLVSGTSFHGVTVTGSAQLSGAAGSPVNLEWAGRPGSSVGVESGEMAGAISSLAPANGTGTGGSIAEAAASFNAFATFLATTVNAVHSLGSTSTGTTGLNFFSVSATGPAALGLGVIPTDVTGIATGRPGAGNLDGSNAGAIAQLGKGPGSPDSSWSAIVTKIGVATKSALQQAVLADSAATADVSAQLANSSVDIDEENINMVTYQTAYQGAARVMTSVDEMLDTLINHTGIVGR